MKLLIGLRYTKIICGDLKQVFQILKLNYCYYFQVKESFLSPSLSQLKTGGVGEVRPPDPLFFFLLELPIFRRNRNITKFFFKSPEFILLEKSLTPEYRCPLDRFSLVY